MIEASIQRLKQRRVILSSQVSCKRETSIPDQHGSSQLPHCQSMVNIKLTKNVSTCIFAHNYVCLCIYQKMSPFLISRMAFNSVCCSILIQESSCYNNAIGKRQYQYNCPRNIFSLALINSNKAAYEIYFKTQLKSYIYNGSKILVKALV